MRDFFGHRPARGGGKFQYRRPRLHGFFFEMNMTEDDIADNDTALGQVLVGAYPWGTTAGSVDSPSNEGANDADERTTSRFQGGGWLGDPASSGSRRNPQMPAARLDAGPDRSHARQEALRIARQEPLEGLSPDEAVGAVREVLDSVGDTCPECN